MITRTGTYLVPTTHRASSRSKRVTPVAPVARERQSSPQARALPAPEPAGLASTSSQSEPRQALPQGRVHPVHLQLTRQGAGRGLRADRDERQRYVRTYQEAAKPARAHPPLISKVA